MYLRRCFAHTCLKGVTQGGEKCIGKGSLPAICSARKYSLKAMSKMMSKITLLNFVPGVVMFGIVMCLILDEYAPYIDHYIREPYPDPTNPHKPGVLLLDCRAKLEEQREPKIKKDAGRITEKNSLEHHIEITGTSVSGCWKASTIGE